MLGGGTLGAHGGHGARGKSLGLICGQSRRRGRFRAGSSRCGEGEGGEQPREDIEADEEDTDSRLRTDVI